MKRLLLDPLVLFIVIWGTVFLLFSLHWSVLLLTFDDSFIEWTVVTLVAAIFGYLAGRLLAGLSGTRAASGQRSRLSAAIRGIAVGMLAIIPFEAMISGGLPIIWHLRGSEKTYTDYGIPTLHGFFNALLLFVGTVSWWMLTSRRARPWVKWVFLACFLLPIVAITRQVLMSLIVQCVIVFVGARVRIHEGVLLRLLAASALAIALFVVIGDLRSNNTMFREQAEISRAADRVPTTFLWPYIYLTTPVNNFLYLTKINTPQTYGAQSLATLTPTVVRFAIFGEKAGLPPILVKETFNVTSYATPLYLDFRWPGVVMFTFVMMALSGYVYQKFKATNDLLSLVMLAVVDQIVIFSFFVNFFLTWGVLFQLVLLVLLRGSMAGVDASALPRRPRRWMQFMLPLRSRRPLPGIGAPVG